MKTNCKKCRERKSVVKAMCARCYYAEKRGYLTYSEQKQKYNFIDNGVGVLTTRKGDRFILDLDDFNKCKEYIWSSTGNGYASNNSVGLLHRYICPQYKTVDHINQNTFDNRKLNLREGHFINVLNSDKRPSPKPIRKNKRGYWYGQVSIEGKRLYVPQSKNRNEIVVALTKILEAAGRMEFYKLT